MYEHTLQSISITPSYIIHNTFAEAKNIYQHVRKQNDRGFFNLKSIEIYYDNCDELCSMLTSCNKLGILRYIFNNFSCHFQFSGDKYETKTVKSGYKVYMKLRIRNVQKEDFMEYRCVAKNSLGGSDGTITLYGKLIAATNPCMRIY